MEFLNDTSFQRKSRLSIAADDNSNNNNNKNNNSNHNSNSNNSNHNSNNNNINHNSNNNNSNHNSKDRRGSTQSSLSGDGRRALAKTGVRTTPTDTKRNESSPRSK